MTLERGMNLLACSDGPGSPIERQRANASEMPTGISTDGVDSAVASSRVSATPVPLQIHVN